MDLSSRIDSTIFPKSENRLKHRSVIVGASMKNEIDRVVESCDKFTKLVKKTKKTMIELPAVAPDPKAKRAIKSNELKKIKSHGAMKNNNSVIQNKNINSNSSKRVSRDVSGIPPILRSKKPFAKDFRQNNRSDIHTFNEEMRIEKQKRKIFKSVFRLDKLLI